MIERWLPYNQTKRRVIFQKAQEKDAIVVKPRNVIIQWEAPQVTVKKDLKYLGIIRANPVEYVQRYAYGLVFKAYSLRIKIIKVWIGKLRVVRSICLMFFLLCLHKMHINL